MEKDEVIALLTAFAKQLQDILEKGVHASRDELNAQQLQRFAAVDKVLAEYRTWVIDTANQVAEDSARVANAMAVNDARFRAVVAYLSGDDPGQAFASSREVSRQRLGDRFDPLLWNEEADWLAKMRRRD